MSLNVLDLTPMAMARMLDELAINFGNKKDLHKRADQWYDQLQRYPEPVVRRVINRLLLEDTKYWPTIGHAMTIAREIAPEVRVTGSSREAYATWERDPWGKIRNLDHDNRLCSSAPCPVCGSVQQFSDRGVVTVHDDAMHKEARVSYSNIGRPEWFSMPAPVYPKPKKRLQPQTPNPNPKKLPAPSAGEIAVGEVEKLEESP